jgi:hypothetical protein
MTLARLARAAVLLASLLAPGAAQAQQADPKERPAAAGSARGGAAPAPDASAPSSSMSGQAEPKERPPTLGKEGAEQDTRSHQQDPKSRPQPPAQKQ